jgi:hypothetical protein
MQFYRTNFNRQVSVDPKLELYIYYITRKNKFDYISNTYALPMYGASFLFLTPIDICYILLFTF